MGLIHLIGAPEPGRRLHLQTRLGWDIPNEQGEPLVQGETERHRLTAQKYLSSRQLGDPSPYYNCHGLTFASRRTMVTDEVTLQRILMDDGYRPIQANEVSAGDIIVYYLDGYIEHSGIVIDNPVGPLRIPTIWSKWGRGSEMIHAANNCPYNYQSVRYYRMTP